MPTTDTKIVTIEADIDKLDLSDRLAARALLQAVAESLETMRLHRAPKVALFVARQLLNYFTQLYLLEVDGSRDAFLKTCAESYDVELLRRAQEEGHD